MLSLLFVSKMIDLRVFTARCSLSCEVKCASHPVTGTLTWDTRCVSWGTEMAGVQGDSGGADEC